MKLLPHARLGARAVGGQAQSLQVQAHDFRHDIPSREYDSNSNMLNHEFFPHCEGCSNLDSQGGHPLCMLCDSSINHL
jgi:hypothetical protein